MKPGSLGMFLAAAAAMGAVCAHAPASAARNEKAPAAEKVFVTGSHIRQPVDHATGAVRTASPMRVYSREQLNATGRQGDLAAALSVLSP